MLKNKVKYSWYYHLVRRDYRKLDIVEVVKYIEIILRTKSVGYNPQTSINTKGYSTLNYQRLLNTIGYILTFHNN